MNSRSAGGTVKSDETLFDIIEALRENDGAGVTSIAEEISVSKSTAHRHLTSLSEYGYVVKEGDTYELSLQFLDVGGYVREQNPLYKRIKPTVQQLAEETGEFVAFLVEQEGLGVYLYSEMGSDGVQNDVRIGRHVHLHQSAAGKAILASLPDDRVSQIVSQHGLEPRTPETITDEGELREDLETIRQQGYAYAHGEHTEGLWAVGVPVHDPDDSIAGALLVAGPTHRMEGDWFEDDLPKHIKGVVKEFELNMSYS